MANGVKAEKLDETKLTAMLVQWYEIFEDGTQTMLANARKARDYYDNKQLSEKQKTALEKRGQPPLVYNLIKPKVDFLIGFEGRQKSDPRAYPRTPFHEQDAEAATDSLRFVADREDLDTKRSRAWHDLLTVGWGGYQKTLKPNPSTQEIDIGFVQNKWDRMWWDVHSAEYDFSDARYLGLVKWLDLDVAKLQYPKNKDDLEVAKTSANTMELHEDRPRNVWFDKKNQRVKICQIYYRTPEGWKFAEYTKGALLKEGMSPFENEHKQRVHPFIWESAYIDQDNNRYGLVLEMMDPQDGVNKRESKLMHLLNSRQSFHKETAVVDAAQFKKELAKPDGSVELQHNAVWGQDAGIIDSKADILGHFQLLQEDKNQIQEIGPNPSIQGKPEHQLSGRALQAQQQGGLIALGGIAGTLRSLDKRAYRSAWNGIRQFWTAEKWVRVTDDERNIRFVGLNQTIRSKAKAGDEEAQFVMQQIIAQGRPEEVDIVVENNVAQMDVDILIEDAPDQVTLQGEQFEQLVGLATAGVTFPPQIYLEAAPNLRNKDKLIEILEQGAEPTKKEIADADEQGSKTMLNRAKSMREITEAAAKAADSGTPNPERFIQ